MNKIKFTIFFVFIFFSNYLMAGALHDAIRQKQWDVAKELLAGGADPNEKYDEETAADTYMTVLFATMNQVLNHLTVTLPEQQPSEDLLSMNDSLTLINTIKFYAEILPYLSQETVVTYATIRASFDYHFDMSVQDILIRCRNSFSSSNPQVSMFVLTQKIKAVLSFIIKQSGVVTGGASFQMTMQEINISADMMSIIQEKIKEAAASLGFNLSDAQILSTMMINLIHLNPLPEERAIIFAYLQAQAILSNSETLNQQPVLAIENQPSESVNTELDSTMVTEISEPLPLLEELSLNENTTVTPETLPPVNLEMGLMDFLPPTSH